MKNIINYKFSFICVIFIYSCSTNENSIVEPLIDQVQIKRVEFKTINLGDSQGLFDEPKTLDSVQYFISNNQIDSYSGNISMNSTSAAMQKISGNITYVNSIIATIKKYNNDEYISTFFYSFNDNGDILEVKVENPTGNFRYSKTVYEYQLDTIVFNTYFSLDDIDYSGIIGGANGKVVLNDNNNRVYIENPIGFPEVTYEYQNGNLLSTNYGGNNGGNSYTYTYTSDINSEAFIYNNTFGKKLNSIHYSNTGAFYFDFLPSNQSKYVSFNALKSFTRTLPLNFLVEHEIVNVIHNSGYLQKREIFQTVNGMLFGVYSIEFFFD
jgi:hypothetical protein